MSLILTHYKRESKEYGVLKYKIKKDQEKYNIVTTINKSSILRQCIKCREFKFTKNPLRLGLCISCHIEKYPETHQTIRKRSNHSRKIKAFSKIQSKIECVRCGCNDIRLLEVNHKNGDGRKTDYNQYRNGHGLYQDIVKNRRKTDDLELLCRPCNHIHYLEMKYGKLPMKVIWSGY